MSNKVLVKFTELDEWLLMRRFPVTQTDISRKSRDIGKKVSPSSVSGFFSGNGRPHKPVFKRIVATIEGSEGITIDFTDSPYNTKIAAGPGGRSPHK